MSQATSKQVFNNTQNKINMENNNTISVGNICNYSIAALVDLLLQQNHPMFQPHATHLR